MPTARPTTRLRRPRSGGVPRCCSQGDTTLPAWCLLRSSVCYQHLPVSVALQQLSSFVCTLSEGSVDSSLRTTCVLPWYLMGFVLLTSSASQKPLCSRFKQAVSYGYSTEGFVLLTGFDETSNSNFFVSYALTRSSEIGSFKHCPLH